MPDDISVEIDEAPASERGNYKKKSAIYDLID